MSGVCVQVVCEGVCVYTLYSMTHIILDHLPPFIVKLRTSLL